MMLPLQLKVNQRQGNRRESWDQPQPNTRQTDEDFAQRKGFRGASVMPSQTLPRLMDIPEGKGYDNLPDRKSRAV